MPSHLLNTLSQAPLDLAVIESLFDCLPDVVFFVKDAAGRYLSVNRALVERCGLRNARELIGKTTTEVFRPPFGARYAAQDAAVIATGQPLTDCLELHMYPSRDPGWCVTNKLSLKDAQHRVTGLIGVSQDLRIPDYASTEFAHVADAVEFAESHLADPLSLRELAERAKMSPWQLDRRIRRVFGMSTGQWLIKLRMDAAERRLRETDDPIAEVALDAGYADQSAFSRQFRRTTGLTPREYRNQVGGEPA